jgi:hypothetical protein
MLNQYHDPRWQKFRLKCFEDRGWRCENCCDSDSTLNVHHVYYVPGRKPWQYPNECVRVLCSECHEYEHEFDRDYDYFGPSKWEKILIEGLHVR